MNRLFQFYFQQ